MARSAVGERSVSSTSSSSSGLHTYFLRSGSTPSPSAQGDGSAQSSPSCSQRSDSPVAATGRTLKKKTSLWSMFTRGSRKASVQQQQQQQQQMEVDPMPMTLSNMSSMSVDVPASSGPRVTLHGMMKRSGSSRLQGQQAHSLDHGTSLAHPFAVPMSRRSLRSQRSMNTVHSASMGSVPSTLRTARSQFTLRLPSGVRHFDTESIFSDDSEGEVSVSWITSTGLRKVGLDFDDDDEEMIDLRR